MSQRRVAVITTALVVAVIFAVVGVLALTGHFGRDDPASSVRAVVQEDADCESEPSHGCFS